MLTGAGISEESGLKTFRGGDGLWENHRIEDVATPHAWHTNPELVLSFYNQRRIQMNGAQPNPAHLALAEMQKTFDVQIITQNVDNLHERAGSKKVLHLHGELAKSRSETIEQLIYDIEGDYLNIGDKCEKGYQLRPHIVWFGEMVPKMDEAIALVKQTDILMIIGTSLQVYPAASLVQFAPVNIPKYYIDPEASQIFGIENLTILKQKAGIALPALKNRFEKS